MKKKIVMILFASCLLSLSACGKNITSDTNSEWQETESEGVNINNELALKYTFSDGMPIFIDSDTEWTKSEIFTVNGSKAIIKNVTDTRLELSMLVSGENNTESYVDLSVSENDASFEKESIVEENGCWSYVKSNDGNDLFNYHDGNVNFLVYVTPSSVDIADSFKAVQNLLYPGNDAKECFNYTDFDMTNIKGKMNFKTNFQFSMSVEDFKEKSGLHLEERQEKQQEDSTAQIVPEGQNTIVNTVSETGTDITISLNSETNDISSIFVAPYDASLKLLNIDDKNIEQLTMTNLYELIGSPDDYSIYGVYGEYTVACSWNNVTFFFTDDGNNIGYVITLTSKTATEN